RLQKQVKTQPESMQARLRSRINKFCSRFPMCGYRLTIHWICLLAFRLVISK
ncbi:phage tail protein, partial [Escherichia coli]